MTRALFIVFQFLIIMTSSAQEISYGDRIRSTVTRIITYNGSEVDFATGFFYTDVEVDTVQNDTIKNVYLVSNRHVLFKKESYPDSITFTMVEFIPSRKEPIWASITLKNKFLKENLKLHENIDIDVAVVSVQEQLQYKNFIGRAMTPVCPIVSNEIGENIEVINPEVGDDVMIVGYPKGFYDDLNKNPLAKSGMISSFYGVDFGGEPKFLIDAKLFNSSSGSIVFSKPKQVLVKDGKILYNKKKQVIFLGIYSGELYVLGDQVESDEAIFLPKRKMNLGNVWYPKVIAEIIRSK